MKNLTYQSLPTQSREPGQWGEGQLSPLTLCAIQGENSGNAKKAGKSYVPVSLQLDWKHQLWLSVCLAVLSILGYYLVSRFVATSVIVQGRSMMPTLQDGDRFILNRWSYFHRSPQRGDVVVVKDPGHSDYAVKRIVGMPGESLYFKKGELLLNGKHLLEPYLTAGTQTFLPDFPEKLVLTGKDQYFVLGDNRGNSEDSRFYGAIHRSQIIGSISR